jgi:hypothetical protein
MRNSAACEMFAAQNHKENTIVYPAAPGAHVFVKFETKNESRKAKADAGYHADF